MSNDIVLRPRFKVKLNKNKLDLLLAFDETKKTQTKFIVNRLDDHVFIKLPKKDQHFWSPQLHLEINEITKNSCLLHGLYGPNPTVWTMFMFFHFIVASLFIAFSIWAYTNWALKVSYALQVSLILFMIIVWICLYFAARLGKASSKTEMIKLKEFIDAVLKKKKL
ncbi:hypothetical protein GCM10022291_20590 [Postechiella marina]|uniref:GTP-binding protein n=1 Tax=Postechiella marina TaxID=943941 RepID=A0ABP8CA33_9FLAO